MTREEQRKIQQTALNTHGIIKQQWMLIEECGELLNAIAKSKRDRAGKDEIITELADVSIIVEQMAFFYGEEDFNKEKERKLLRLKERLQKHIPKQMELPKRGDIVRITKIAEIAKLHKAKLREGDLCEVISSWACPCDNGESVKYVRIKYPNGKRKEMPIRSYIYEWEIVEEQQ
jgi:NTP pyrophosphatase (non-canonical NTP hydrolase)